MKCLICGCSEDEVKKLFCFPKNSERLTLWQKNLGMVYRSNMSTNHRICSNHFNSDSFKNQTPTLKLKRDALPIQQVFSYNQKVNVVDCSINHPNTGDNNKNTELNVVDCNINYTNTADNNKSTELTVPQVILPKLEIDSQENMGYCCCVPNCKNNSNTEKMRVFPSNPILFVRWIKLIGREDLLQKGMRKVRVGYKVCDAHFRDEDRFAENRNRSNLKRYVVPSLLINGTETTSESTSMNDLNPPLSDTNSFNHGSRIDLPSTTKDTISDSIQIDSRCRVCLQSDHGGISLSTVTNIDSEPKTLFEILNMCTFIKISQSDGGPQTICIDCVERAKAAYEFNVLCRKSHVKLQNEGGLHEQVCHSMVEGKEKNTEKEETVVRSERSVPIPATPKIATFTPKAPSKEIKKIVCVQCRKTFHKHSKHKLFLHVCVGKKRYFCTICGARYSLRKNFNLHQRFHVKDLKRDKLLNQWHHDKDVKNLFVKRVIKSSTLHTIKKFAPGHISIKVNRF